ncbi:hypothetical protein RJT34_03079 [Clitoria ternatea]|uniref:Uncharacterized protein n=1 Tax=Clitoria ternatea TaxID=43366 RepID=A0AAN9PZG6_CLITE
MEFRSMEEFLEVKDLWERKREKLLRLQHSEYTKTKPPLSLPLPSNIHQTSSLVSFELCFTVLARCIGFGLCFCDGGFQFDFQVLCGLVFFAVGY